MDLTSDHRPSNPTLTIGQPICIVARTEAANHELATALAPAGLGGCRQVEPMDEYALAYGTVVNRNARS